MEKELNIAAILKEKPVGTKLWTPIYGDCIFNYLTNTDIRVSPRKDGQTYQVQIAFLNDGRYSFTGEVCLFPSKKMQYWSKFVWKKGDVLQISDVGFCTFEKWTSDDYTTFKGRYGVNLGKNSDGYYIAKEYLNTFMWCKVDDDNLIKQYLDEVEQQLGGKLNLETLEIEYPKQEFKDGDIVVLNEDKAQNLAKLIAIYNGAISEGFDSYAYLNVSHKDIVLGYEVLSLGRVPHCATDQEKQQLFDALAKENKRWNPDTKQIEDLPKKCEFKVMDYILIRANRKWDLYQFSYESSTHVHVVGMQQGFGKSKFEILPYNEETKYLLGTTDEWKGGEK